MKYGLNDKSQALSFIVKKFKDGGEEQPTPLYLNDGDEWMLAEDIPDIGFYFSQIWLSCFVNEAKSQ